MTGKKVLFIALLLSKQRINEKDFQIAFDRQWFYKPVNCPAFTDCPDELNVVKAQINQFFICAKYQVSQY